MTEISCGARLTTRQIVAPAASRISKARTLAGVDAIRIFASSRHEARLNNKK
jgi:hypothetical protein